jgi:hypothetical protein
MGWGENVSGVGCGGRLALLDEPTYFAGYVLQATCVAFQNSLYLRSYRSGQLAFQETEHSVHCLLGLILRDACPSCYQLD